MTTENYQKNTLHLCSFRAQTKQCYEMWGPFYESIPWKYFSKLFTTEYLQIVKVLGTKESILATQVLVQNCHTQTRDVIICFIDTEKVFDRFQHLNLIQLLRRLDTDRKDTRSKTCTGTKRQQLQLTMKLQSHKKSLEVRDKVVSSPPFLFNL